MKAALLATVNDEHSTVEAFVSVLALETEALTAVSPLEQLPPIVEQKTELIGMLANLERHRDEQLAELGLPAGKPGMTLAVQRDPALAQSWSRLLAVAERARHANTLNGEMIRVRMDYNDRALAALQVVAPRKSHFYGPDGKVPQR